MRHRLRTELHVCIGADVVHRPARAPAREFLSAPIAVDELRERILERIFGTRDRAQISTLALDESDWQAAREVLGRKYGAAAWTYGENLKRHVQPDYRFPGGEIDVRIDVQEGRIAGIRIFGDFMTRRDVDELQARMIDP